MVIAGSENLNQSVVNTAENKPATREVGCIIGRLATVVKAGWGDFSGELQMRGHNHQHASLVLRAATCRGLEPFRDWRPVPGLGW